MVGRVPMICIGVVSSLCAPAKRSLSFCTTTKRIARASTATNTTTVWILRHGQTDANAGGIIQGSSDASRLTDLGRDQAAAVARGIDFATKVNSVYASPLTRAQETLRLIQHESLSDDDKIPLMSPMTLNNLREIDFYDWEGRHKDDLQSSHPDSWAAWKEGNPHDLMVMETGATTPTRQEQRYPLLELWQRASQVWKEIQVLEDNSTTSGGSSSCSNGNSGDKTILLVAHGSLGQALLGTAMGWDATHFRRHEFPNCGMAEIQWDHYGGTFASGSELAARWRWKWPDTTEWQTRGNESASDKGA